MDLEIGQECTLMKGETFVTGKLRGIRLRKDDLVEAMWIDEIETAFYPADGWMMVDDSGDDELQMLFAEDEEEEEDE